jgi:hypothetical protein
MTPLQINSCTVGDIAHIGTIFDPQQRSLRRHHSVVLDELAAPVRDVVVQFGEHALAISWVDDVLKRDGARFELLRRVAEVGDVAGYILDRQPDFHACSVQHDAILFEDKLRDCKFLSEQPGIHAISCLRRDIDKRHDLLGFRRDIVSLIYALQQN